jgi:protein ImuB
MGRVISLWLPSFPTDRITRARAAAKAGTGTGAAAQGPGPRGDRPLATLAGEQGRLVIAAANEAAIAAGIFPGQPLADARAILPSLEAVDHDASADAAALDRLAEWCSRYSPLVALDGADGLFLETAGCAHLFGGEEAMLGDLQARLGRSGLAAVAALADTPGAAWAVARFGAGVRLVPEGGAREALANLPVASLRLAPAEVFDLGRLGLRRAGDLYGLPRAPLAARFGGRLLLRLDQALGCVEEPISPCHPVPPYRVRLGFAEPILAAEDIARAIRYLLHELCERLQREQVGARRLDLSLYRVDATVRRLRIGTARPNRDPERLMGLFARHLEKIDPGFGIEVAALAAPVVEACAPEQYALSPDGPAADGPARADLEEDLAALVERLSNRLAARAVVRLLPKESHIPERAQRASPALAHPPSPSRAPGAARAVSAARPLRLLAIPQPIEAVAPVPDDPPVLFRWRSTAHRVRLAEGPERIACEWWREAAPFRDYYRVEDTEGRRFWLYREGLYRPDVPARWFLHGMFP